MVSFLCHRLQDSDPVAWVLAFPVSNRREAAVASSSLIHSMTCSDAPSPTYNVSKVPNMNVELLNFVKQEVHIGVNLPDIQKVHMVSQSTYFTTFNLSCMK